MKAGRNQTKCGSFIFTFYFHFSEDFGYWSQFPFLIISVLSGHMYAIPILLSYL